MRRLSAVPLALVVFSAAVVAEDVPTDCKALKSAYEGKTHYLQHNLYHEDGEATWVNFMATGDFLPVGAPVTVRKLKSDEALLEITDETGRQRTVEWDLEEALPDCATVLKRSLRETAPSSDGMQSVDREGIRRGVIIEGMSRNAVFLAVGYPPYFYERPWSGTPARNKDLTLSELTFAGSTYDFIIVKFENDHVKAIDD